MYTYILLNHSYGSMEAGMWWRGMLHVITMPYQADGSIVSTHFNMLACACVPPVACTTELLYVNFFCTLCVDQQRLTSKATLCSRDPAPQP